MDEKIIEALNVAAGGKSAIEGLLDEADKHPETAALAARVREELNAAWAGAVEKVATWKAEGGSILRGEIRPSDPPSADI